MGKYFDGDGIYWFNYEIPTALFILSNARISPDFLKIPKLRDIIKSMNFL